MDRSGRRRCWTPNLPLGPSPPPNPNEPERKPRTGFGWKKIASLNPCWFLRVLLKKIAFRNSAFLKISRGPRVYMLVCDYKMSNMFLECLSCFRNKWKYGKQNDKIQCPPSHILLKLEMPISGNPVGSLW